MNDNNAIYKRYIDDAILGPFKRDDDMFHRILEVLNSIDDNIKFTLESPSNGCLNFLDLSLWITKKQIVYKHYRKDLSSGLALSKQSWLPSYIKTNYVQQSFERVKERCSPALLTEQQIKCHNDCYKALLKNGYSPTEISKPRKNR